jgi:hypothetical protein
MAQNTLESPPINPSIAKWIENNKDVINSTAKLLGVPATAIALAAAEEASHIVTSEPQLEGFDIPRENLQDSMQDFGPALLKQIPGP